MSLAAERVRWLVTQRLLQRCGRWQRHAILANKPAQAAAITFSAQRAAQQRQTFAGCGYSGCRALLLAVEIAQLQIVLSQLQTELGVAAIRPVFTARSVPRAGGATVRPDRLRSAAISACEQCGRSVLPGLLPAATLDTALAEIPPGTTLRIVPWESGGAPIVRVLRAAAPGPCAVIVGPEGGLAADEIERAVAHGFVPVSLGARILRTETVAPALLGLLAALRGDLAQPD